MAHQYYPTNAGNSVQSEVIPPFHAIRQVLASIRRRWLSGFLFATGMVAISFLATLFIENSYQSEALLFVKLGRESVALDPTVTSKQTIAVNDSRETEVNSIVEVLRSREIAKIVVDKIGVTEVLGRKEADGTAKPTSSISSFIGSLIGMVRSYHYGGEVSDEEKATSKLLKSLEVHSPRRTTVISVNYASRSPETSRRVVDNVLEVFFREHVRINRIERSHQFLADQTELLDKRLAAAQERMRDAKSELGIVTIEGARKKLQEELETLSSRLIAADAEQAGSKMLIENLTRSEANVPSHLTNESVSGLPNEATDKMRDTLYQLEVKERELAANLTNDHPSLTIIRKQLSEARAIYDAQEPEREETRETVHPTKQSLELTLLNEKAQLAALSGEINALNQRMERAESELKTLNQAEVRIAALQREIDISEHSYEIYSEKLEQSRLDQELQSEKISNVNVIQPATFLERPASPSRLLILLIGAFCGLVGGLALPVVLDAFQSIVKHSHQHRDLQEDASFIAEEPWKNADLSHDPQDVFAKRSFQ